MYHGQGFGLNLMPCIGTEPVEKLDSAQYSNIHETRVLDLALLEII